MTALGEMYPGRHRAEKSVVIKRMLNSIALGDSNKQLHSVHRTVFTVPCCFFHHELLRLCESRVLQVSKFQGRCNKMSDGGKSTRHRC